MITEPNIISHQSVGRRVPACGLSTTSQLQQQGSSISRLDTVDQRITIVLQNYISTMLELVQEGSHVSETTGDEAHADGIRVGRSVPLPTWDELCGGAVPLRILNGEFWCFLDCILRNLRLLKL